MSAHSFLCPHCQAKLRFADESLLEKPFACPDCGRGIEIARGDGEWRAIPARSVVIPPAEKKPVAQSKQSDARTSSPATSDVTPATPQKQDRLAEWIGSREQGTKPAPSRSQPVSRLGQRVASGLAPRFEWLKSPLTVTWLVAGFATLTIIIWLLRDASLIRETAVTIDREADSQQLASADSSEPADESHSVAQQLRQLGERIDAYQQEYGRYPAGRITLHDDGAETRFSWIAELESAIPSTSRPGQAPLWDRSWSDPLNDGFVRRRLPALINPLAAEQVGADGFPTTHFVGIAGLGVDGPTLPANHPLAGIFGHDRITRPEDVKDGASNTIMVAGVQNRLGSWANGDTSIRPFTKVPYVNGPDGFGTGQEDGMFVLMADGTVKFLSSDIDPVVMRRMTAMADGLPLDPAVPGDPLDITPPVMIVEADPPMHVEPEQPEVVEPVEIDISELSPEAAALANEPIEVPIAADLPRVFIERSLQVSLRRFEQRDPVALRLMLRTLEELIGSPFGWNVPDSDEWAGILERDVTITLENTTVEGVLSEVLTSVGLKYRLEDEGIYIEPM